MEQKFIRTLDKSTAQSLTKSGFQQIDKTNGVFTFLNNINLKFEKDFDKTKVQYSNVLFI